MLRSILSLITILFFCSTVQVQQADSTLKKSLVKTLTDKQYTALLNGDDMYGNMALTAQINHYPMPDQVIKFKKELGLSPNQVVKISAIATELHRKRVEMGSFIIKNEQTLDELFRKQRLSNGDVIFYATRSGLYYGELRNAILQACLSTGDLMAPQQIKKLETLQNPN